MYFAANAAGWIACNLDTAPFHAACVQQQQATSQGGADICNDFQCFGCLHAANDADDGRKYTHGGAIDFIELLIFRKQAGVAGSISACVKYTDLAIEANCSP